MLPSSLLLDVVFFLRSETLVALRLSTRDLTHFILARMNELPKHRLAVYVTDSAPSLRCKLQGGQRFIALQTERLSAGADSISVQVLYFAYGLKFTDELLEFLDGLKLHLRYD